MHDRSIEEFLGRTRSGVIGRHLRYYASVSSTMDISKQLAREGAEEGTVVVAGEQTGGRGRMGRTWISPAGAGVAFSVILHPKPAQLGQLNMLASLAVCKGIERVTSLKPGIKWPNDVLIHGKKVSGILIENEFEGDRLVAAVVGIGINVDLGVKAHPEIAEIATSLSLQAGRPVSQSDTLHSVLDALEEIYADMRAGKDVYRLWLPLVETVGKMVRVKYGEAIVEGFAESVDRQGRLVLRKRDGGQMHMAAGEVTFQTS